jgi:hypothetical protein
VALPLTINLLLTPIRKDLLAVLDSWPVRFEVFFQRLKVCRKLIWVLSELVVLVVLKLYS